MKYSSSTQKVINFLSIVSKQKIKKQNKEKSPQIIPLDEQTKNDFELKNNTNIKDTMIYIDPDDDFPNPFILAYALANKIHIRKSHYNPGSTETKEILEHELTHIQQYCENRIKASIDELEYEAIQNETQHLRHGEKVYLVEIIPEKYYSMTKTEYKKLTTKMAEIIVQDFEKYMNNISDDENKLEYILKLKSWAESYDAPKIPSSRG